MPSTLSRVPSPRTFTEALKREVLQPAAERVAGEDGLVSAREVASAARLLRGGERLAVDSFRAAATGAGVEPSPVAEFVDRAAQHVYEAAREAADGDNRLSKRNVEALPPDLRLAYHFLRTGEIPLPELRYSQRVVDDVMERFGLSDLDALLRTAFQLSGDNNYLNRAELTAAAEALKQQHPPLLAALPADWRAVVEERVDAGQVAELGAFVEEERRAHTVYPPPAEVFTALERTPLDKVKVVLLGQDPYHGEGEAHGLSFSVKPGVRVPPSLRNMYKELNSALGCDVPDNGCLEEWADRGVLLLNAVLTVREDSPASHRGKGWEQVTDALLSGINESEEPVVFLLLGRDAQRKAGLIDTARHTVITAAHPSPFSANHGFFGTNPFGRVNDALVAAGREPIDWQISDRES